MRSRTGVAERKLSLLPAWRESGLFTSREAAALPEAEALAMVAETHAPNDVYAELASSSPSARVGDLTIALSLINAFNRVAIGFRKGSAGARDPGINPGRNQGVHR